MIKIDAPVPSFADLDGSPLTDGVVYIGATNQNPEVNPIQVYWDAALTQPAAQPLRTLNGVICRQGTPSPVYTNSAYSITVRNKQGRLIYTFPDSTYFDGVLVGSASFSKAVSNVAALRNVAQGSASYVITAGYYTSGDGGGGTYYYDATDTTSSDNGGTIIVASDGGRWKLVYGAYVLLKQFGAKGNSNGTTGNGQDDTTYIQAALTWATTTTMRRAELWADEGIFRCTSGLTAAAGFKIRGVRPRAKGPGGTDFGGGSWLYFDHTGKGLSATDSGGYYTDVELTTIGTCRNQPAPAASWSPNPHDWDLYLYGIADIVLHDVLMLNPTKGVGVFGSPTHGPGRLELYNFRAQAFTTGIQIDTTYDVTRMDHIHFWPFWRDDSRVHAYCMANLDAIYSLRNDNPMMSNIFTIFAHAGLRIGQGANGGTSKVHLVNADFDRGAYGIWIDSTATDGCTGQYDNITHQGENGFAESKGIFVQGNNCTMQVGSFDTGYCWQNGVRIEGTGNVVTFGHAKVSNFDQQAANFPAFEALTGNYMTFATRPFVGGSGGTGGAFASTGTVVCDQWRNFTPAVSSATGAITTLGLNQGRYKLVGNTVHVEYDITITTIGTAAGDIRFTLPFGSAVYNFIGAGRETASTGKMHSVTIEASANYCFMNNYDGTFVGFSGARLVGKFEYEINTGI